MVNSFALVSAAARIRVEDYFARGKQPRFLGYVPKCSSRAYHVGFSLR
jgi:hypothetical protein